MGTATRWFRQQIFCGLFVAILAGSWIHCRAQSGASDFRNERSVGSSFNGRVVASNGPLQRDTRIELRSTTGQTVCSTYTDASGSFHCSDVVPGLYQLIVSSERNEQTVDISVGNFRPEVTIKVPDAKINQDQTRSVSVSELMVPAKARKVFEKAAERFQRADLAGTRAELDKALEIWPRFAAALTLRGVLKMHSRVPHDAIQDFNAALDVDRSYGLAYIGLAANHNATGKFDEALKVLDRGRPYLTQMWQLHYETSKSLLGKRAFTRAIEEANRASAMLGQDTPGVCLIKSQAYLNLDNARAARTEIENYLKRNHGGPGIERLRQLLGSINDR